MGRVRASYTSKFKLQVVLYAQENGNRAAGKKFDVDEKNVRRWIQAKDALEKTSQNRQSFRGKKAKYPDLETNLLDYVRKIRKDGFSVSREMMQFEALRIANDMEIPQDEFKASYGWVRRFMARHDLVIRRRTSMAQKLPDAYQEKLLAFQKHVISLRKTHDYSLGAIGNADETPVFFEMPGETTVNDRGEKTVQVRTAGAEKQRCTVMLGITADGNKLPPYVIFRRKTLPKEKLPPGILVMVQEKGWMTEDLYLDWLKRVWFRRPGTLLRRPSMLVIDSFRGHLTDKVKMKMRQEKSDMVVIPGGMTGILQPLDVSINRPFKVHMRRMYREWRCTSKETTPSGRLKKPSLFQMCEWIVAAWDLIPREIVSKSFKVTSISNAMDGSEDDVVWAEVPIDSGSDSGNDGDSDSDDEL